MTKRASFSAANITRVLAAARKVDPTAVLKLAIDGSLQILPYVPDAPEPDPVAAKVDDFFARHDKPK